MAGGRWTFLSNILHIAIYLADNIEGSPSGPPITHTEFTDVIFGDLIEREFPGSSDG